MGAPEPSGSNRPRAYEPRDRRREETLDRVHRLAGLLCGEVVLAPLTADGEFDAIGFANGGCTDPGDEVADADVPRLCVLIEQLERFVPEAPSGVRVVVLDRGGTPQVIQVDGRPCLGATLAVVDAVANQTALVETRPPARPANDNKPLPAPSPLPLIDPSTWAGQPVPERVDFLPGMIPSRTVTLLSGDGGTGKSLLSLQIGVASALATSTAGLLPQAARVLYVGAEDEADEFHRRLAAIVDSAGGALSDLAGAFLLAPLADRDATLMAPTARGGMAPTDLFEALVDAISEFRPGLVVLDTAADLFGGDEVKRVQVRAFIAALRMIAVSADCAILLLAHPSVAGMASGSGTSGSTAWSNSVRSRLYLSRPRGDVPDPDARLLEVMKSNYGAVGEKVRLRWQEGVFVQDSPASSAALRLVHARHNEVFIELLSTINHTGQRVGASTGTSYAPAKMAKMPGANGIGKRELEAAMQRLLETDVIRLIWDGPPSRQRQKLVVSAEDFSGPATKAA